MTDIEALNWCKKHKVMVSFESVDQLTDSGVHIQFSVGANHYIVSSEIDHQMPFIDAVLKAKMRYEEAERTIRRHEESRKLSKVLDISRGKGPIRH